VENDTPKSASQPCRPIPAIAKEKDVFYRDVWNSSDGVAWTEVKPKEPFWPQRGMIGGSTVFKDRIWILGGGTYDTPTIPTRKFFNDVWSSADGIAWTRHLESAPWAPRQYHDVAVFDDRLWVLEGYYTASRPVNHILQGMICSTPGKFTRRAFSWRTDNVIWVRNECGVR
jgi:hypothetical protein